MFRDLEIFIIEVPVDSGLLKRLLEGKGSSSTWRQWSDAQTATDRRCRKSAHGAPKARPDDWRDETRLDWDFGSFPSVWSLLAPRCGSLGVHGSAPRVGGCQVQQGSPSPSAAPPCFPLHPSQSLRRNLTSDQSPPPWMAPPPPPPPRSRLIRREEKLRPKPSEATVRSTETDAAPHSASDCTSSTLVS